MNSRIDEEPYETDNKTAGAVTSRSVKATNI